MTDGSSGMLFRLMLRRMRGIGCMLTVTYGEADRVGEVARREIVGFGLLGLFLWRLGECLGGL